MPLKENWNMKRTLLTITISIFYLTGFAFFPDPLKEFNFEQMQLIKDELETKFSNNKMLDEEFMLATLIALSYYPELENHRIKFKQKNIKTTMQSVPTLGNIFRKKSNRVYKIKIDNKVRKNKGLLLTDVPFNAQIGVIGHELAHIVDYDSKTKTGLIFLGAAYLFPNKRCLIENRVDEITIEHGLGYQVKDFSMFVLNNKGINERYLKYKKKFYYNPNQLLRIMVKNPIY